MDDSTLENRFTVLLEDCKGFFTSDDLSAVMHYLNHAELEMAGEAFCLELFRKDVELSKQVADEIKSLAIDLGLTKDTVFDPDLWEKLPVYVNHHVKNE